MEEIEHNDHHGQLFGVEAKLSELLTKAIHAFSDFERTCKNLGRESRTGSSKKSCKPDEL